MTRLGTAGLMLFVVLLAAGCRGMTSEAPPLHLNTNMDVQERFNAQGENPFFADGMAQRPPVPGTIARDQLREDVPFYEGRVSEGGAYIPAMPIPVTAAVLKRGQERYHIYCTPCHGDAGDGKGVIMTGNYGFTPAPTFHDERLRTIEDGYIYDVIRRGVRTMPSYGAQISPADRWAIVSYVRALQRSQNATAADVPAGMRAGVGASTAQGSTAAAADTTR